MEWGLRALFVLLRTLPVRGAMLAKTLDAPGLSAPVAATVFASVAFSTAAAPVLRVCVATQFLCYCCFFRGES